MTAFTFYFKNRKRRVPVGSLDKWPSDWLDVRNGILDAAREVYRKYHSQNELLFLERHLGGKSFLGTVDYKVMKIHYRRSREGVFKVEYSPKNDVVEVLAAWFGFSLSWLRPQFLLIEKGTYPSVPNLISRQAESLLNSEKFLVQMSGSRFAPSYERTAQGAYGSELKEFEKKGTYQKEPVGTARAVS